jgi:D-alanyl-lipoteichoic acid acyltransferase DltB (MBOAT superfamily)
LVGIIAFGIYLYNDFAGYTGIVRGISLFIGINLSPNFQVPYLSYSLSDFWSRWHISLSSWLRDYIYFPMVRYFKKKSNGQSAIIPIIIPLLSTMLISGLWHGMTIPLLIWGLTYGIIMIVEQFSFQKWPVLRPQQHSAVVKGIAGILTFSIVTLAWVPFTASSIGEILAFWRVIFKGSGLNSSPDFSFLILVLVFVSFFLDFFQSRNKDETFILKWPLIARASIMSIAFLALLLASTWTTQNVTNVFIYQGF